MWGRRNELGCAKAWPAITQFHAGDNLSILARVALLDAGYVPGAPQRSADP
jgi:hypothetical protein